MPCAVAMAMCVGAILPTTAMAETNVWRDVGGWEVSYFPDAEACQAFAVFERDTAFFIGFDGTGEKLSLNVSLIDQSWTEISAGVEYPVRVQFGGNPAWTLGMDGQIINDVPALNIHIDAQSPEAELFVREFKQETQMIWTLGDVTLAHLTLRGSSAAFNAVLECQAADHSAHMTTASGLPTPEEPTSD